MGDKIKHRSAGESARNRRLEPSHRGGPRGAGVNHAAALSTATIMELQRQIGNQGVLRLVAGRGSDEAPREPVQRADGAGPLVQRDALTDIRVESEDFWSHVMTRVMVRYGQWISDTRQALNQFVTDMGEKNSDARGDWGSALQSWFGVAGTPGDVINAVITTTKAFLDELPAGKTFSLAELSNIENAALQRISEKTGNVDSDLPIYQTLRNKRLNEKPTSRSEYREGVRAEVEAALKRLPPPNHLRQKMVVQWMQGASKGGAATGKITHDTVYLANKDRNVVGGELGFFDLPVIEDVDRPDATITALRGAYGGNAELHKLPVYFNVRIWGTPTGDVAFDRHLWADWVKEDGVWKPRKGLGTEFSYDLVSEWLKNGRKPTIDHLVSARTEYW